MQKNIKHNLDDSKNTITSKQIPALIDNLMSEACAVDRKFQQARTSLDSLYDQVSNLQEYFQHQKLDK
jgi:hypothetical protein